MLAVALIAMMAPDDFTEKTVAWRGAREASLLRPTGWLSVAALTWLREGEQTFGSAPTSGVVFPKSAPASAGVLTLKDGSVTVRAAEGVSLLMGDKPYEGVLRLDSDRVKLGDLTFMIIKRGKRIGVRLWDPNARSRTGFEGCKWFAPDPKLVVVAKFVPHPKGKTIPIMNILGDTEPSPNPGYVEFVIDGKKQRLEAIDEDGGLFFNFKDATSGKETYPPGRFLNTEAPKDGKVTLDFNRAVNPPCAFTSYATCPLAPKSNWLKVRIPAGELTHHPVE